jgi:ribosomal protein L2
LKNIKASITVGNVLPVGQMPEGTVVCQLEEKSGDRGKLARASGKKTLMKIYYKMMKK